MGGGGKSHPVQTISATPTSAPAPIPPAPPAEEAKMREYTDPTKDAQKAKAVTQGAASLQIPLGTVGTKGTIGQV